MTACDLGADVADTWLDNPAAGKARRVERDVNHATQRISWLIYRINTPALRYLLMGPKNVLRMRDSLVSPLAGNLWGSWGAMVPVLAFKSVFFI